MTMETLSRYLLTFLFNSLWQIPVIACVAALACRLMRNGPARHRHAVWVAALLLALVMPLASIRSVQRTAGSGFKAPAAPQLSASSPFSANAAGSADTSPAAARHTISYAQTTAIAVVAIYLLFLMFRFIRLSRAWMHTMRIRQSAGLTVDSMLVRHVWQRCVEAFGLRDIELLSSRQVLTPVAAGAWRKAIILPEPLFSSTNEDVLTTAIGHEMAHLARHDFALKVLYEVLYMPVAFHPASWLIRRGLEETREMACDELVTHKLLDAAIYARSLMTIASAVTPLPCPGYTLGVFDGDILEQRIRSLLHRPAVNLKRARLLLAGGLSAIALCAMVVSGISVTARAQTGDLTSRVRALEPMINELKANAADVKLISQIRQALSDILALDPANQEGLNGMMTVSLLAKQPLEARQWALRIVAQYPREKTSYYCVATTDWSVVYNAVTAARAAAGMRPEDTNFIADAATRRTLRDQYGPLVDEGTRMLETSLRMDPQYSDAMAYMNLLYRMKANISENEAESAASLSIADEWVGKALAARRLEAASSPRSNTSLRSNSWTAAPPPPPPPPPPPISDTALTSDAPMPPRLNTKERPGTFWQVMGASDTHAKTLIAQLKAQGFRASPAVSGGDMLVRVMVGPYDDEASLAEVRSKLEAAGYRVIRSWR
jgi:beta-lactamase regulating signal transducer with metallopeptidase domain/cell division septation protein DedD